jgi:hypothetical protein
MLQRQRGPYHSACAAVRGTTPERGHQWVGFRPHGWCVMAGSPHGQGLQGHWRLDSGPLLELKASDGICRN